MMRIWSRKGEGGGGGGGGVRWDNTQERASKVLKKKKTVENRRGIGIGLTILTLFL
jgi:hypothetical protein